jgi:DNA-binding Xre family transcriptional regulator
MSLHQLTNTEIAARLAQALRAWRISPQGAAMSQVELAHKSGIGLTPLKRFEKTGAITLRNLLALLRALDLLDGLENLIPEPDAPGPLELLAAERKRTQRKRAPRTGRSPTNPERPHG